MELRARQDQLIISYLLGQVSDIEQNQIEGQYFRDPQFFDEMLALEEELICAYLSGQLLPNQRQSFEHHFLRAPRRRQKFEATKQWMQMVARQSAKSTRNKQTEATTQNSNNNVTQAERPHVSRLDWLTVSLLPRLSFRWILTIALLLMGFSWWLTARVTTLREEAQQTEATRLVVLQQEQKLRGKAEERRGEVRAKSTEVNSLSQLAQASMDQLQASLDPPSTNPAGTGLASPSPGSEQKTPASTPASATNRTGMPNFALTVPNLRIAGPMQMVKLRTDLATTQWYIDLDTSQTEFASYRAQIKALDGHLSLTRHHLKPQVVGSSLRLVLDIPINQFRRGEYMITLTGMTPDNEAKRLGEVTVQLVP